MTPSDRLTRRRCLLLLASAAACATVPRASAQAPVLGSDGDGRPIASLAEPPTRFVVTVFLATDCPISSRYMPEIARLARQFQPQGVRFWLVYPNSGDDVAALRAYHSGFANDATLSTMIAPAALLIRRAGVHVTPEAALFRAPVSLEHPSLWHGRIDDRYLSIGTQRPAPTHRDLEEAIRATLAGGEPPAPTGRAVGCVIVPRGATPAARSMPLLPRRFPPGRA